MNRLFNFAKVFAICFLVLSVIQGILIIIQNVPILHTQFGYYVITTMALILTGLWLTFYAMIIANSANRSPVVIPSWIAIAALIFALANSILGIYKQLDYNPHISSISGILRWADAIGAAVSFIWLSKYFQRGSILRVMAIMLAVLNIVEPIFYMVIPWGKLYSLLNYNLATVIWIVISLFWRIMFLVPTTIFLFAFSKLKNKKFSDSFTTSMMYSRR